MFHQCVPEIHAQIIFDKIGQCRPNNELKWTFNKMIRLSIIDINPKSEFVAEPGLIEISQPQLLAVMNGFIRCLCRSLDP